MKASIPRSRTACRRGVDVTTPRDVGLIGADDSDHLTFCTTQIRVIVTHDDDFLAMASAAILTVASRLPYAGALDGEILGALMLIRDCLTPEGCATTSSSYKRVKP